MSNKSQSKPWSDQRTQFDRNLAVVIGIDHYDSSGIHDLSTAVNDANTIANVLQSHYGYKEENIIRLLSPRSEDSTLKALTQSYREATLDNLITLLTKDLPEKLKPTEGDRLLFYFAGHGIPQESEDGPAGYLIPQTAKLGDLKTYLPMRELHDALKQLSCHHLLIILDCCFGGMFRWASSRKLISVLETVRREHYDRFIRYPAWQVITSAAHNEEALDLSVDHRKGEENSRHSPFAQALIEGLLPDDKGRTKADFIPDGVITAHELFLHLNNRVSELSKSRQTPGIYPMRLEYDKGEYIFTSPDFKRNDLTPAPDLNEENNPYRGLKPFDEKHSSFFFGRNALVQELNDRLTKPGRSLTVVLGASGSGKSSLVKAGLIPYLREKHNKEQSGQQWYILNPMRPGKFPFTELARSILPIVDTHLTERVKQVKAFTDSDSDPLADTWNRSTPEAKLLLVVDYFDQLNITCSSSELKNLKDEIQSTVDQLNRDLRNNLRYLAQVINTWGQNNPNTRLLLVIDQFEELITMTQEHQERNQSDQSDGQSGDKEWQQFLTMLKTALASHPHPLHLVLTLRSDFEPRFLESELKEEWREARFPVRAMNSEELRQAIEGPALKQALVFNPDNLVSTLIDEVGQMPGALPLLSFALSELYIKLHRRWKMNGSTDRTLTLEDYTELGGVAGSLTRRATEEYDKLVKDKDTSDEHQGGFGAEEGKAYQITMRRVMLRMVAIEGGGVARRRVPVTELVYSNEDENERVKTVIERLVNARLVVKGQESEASYVEPAHDFLVRGWDQLQTWIKQNQTNLALQQRLTPAANDWNRNDRDSEYLWIRDPRLALLEEFLESEENKRSSLKSERENWLNKLELEFVKASKRKRIDELEETKQQLQISEERRIAAEQQLASVNAQRQFETEKGLNALLNAMQVGRNLLEWKQGKNLLLQDYPTTSPLFILQTILDNLYERNYFFELDGQNNFREWLEGKSQSSTSETRIRHGENWLIRSPDGQHFITLEQDEQNRTESRWQIWKFPQEPLTEVLQSGLRFHEAKFSPNSKIIAIIGSRAVEFYDLTGKSLGKIDSASKQVEFSPDASKVIIIEELSNAEGIQRMHFLERIVPKNDKAHRFNSNFFLNMGEVSHHRYYGSARFTPNGQFLITAGPPIRIWDLKPQMKLKAVDSDFQEFSKASQTWLEKNWTDGVVQCSNEDGVIATLEGSENWFDTVILSPKKQFIASIDEGNTVRIWTVLGQKLIEIEGNKGVFRRIVFSPQDNYFAIIERLEVTIISISQNFQTIGTIQGNESQFSSLSFSPDEQRIATAGSERIIRLWDLKARQLAELKLNDPRIAIIAGHTLDLGDGFSARVSFSQDGQHIVFQSDSRVWMPTLLWKVDSLEDLLARGDQWLADYWKDDVDAKLKRLIDLELIANRDSSTCTDETER